MPRRKIGADLKEALCKLYEAGDITADTIEKHGIMSRATFFRNLKMYKTGASLEQRFSTGRKSNADKLKEQEKQDFDRLQPSSLSELELILVDDRELEALSRLKKREKAPHKSVKRRESGHDAPSSSTTAGASSGGDRSRDEQSGSESDVDEDEASADARQSLQRLARAAREYLQASTQSAAIEGLSTPSSSGMTMAGTDAFADLESLAKPEDSQYSHKNRGALYIVRQKGGEGGIVAALAIQSLIWTPQIYQSLGQNYASRSIDKICHLTRIHVDRVWRRRGLGRWLMSVAELKASRLGFSHLYTQSAATDSAVLSFWQKSGLLQFALFDGLARLEKAVTPSEPSSVQSGKRSAPSASTPSAPQPALPLLEEATAAMNSGLPLSGALSLSHPATAIAAARAASPIKRQKIEPAIQASAPGCGIVIPSNPIPASTSSSHSAIPRNTVSSSAALPEPMVNVEQGRTPGADMPAIPASNTVTEEAAETRFPMATMATATATGSENDTSVLMTSVPIPSKASLAADQQGQQPPAPQDETSRPTVATETGNAQGTSITSATAADTGAVSAPELTIDSATSDLSTRATRQQQQQQQQQQQPPSGPPPRKIAFHEANSPNSDFGAAAPRSAS
ncbi:hypothetical protein BCV70DRAFT_202663 [Testicularia cyperi]|uniref:N-acetyltransferase domain-containing protein n=1 Tax=Testicularia cyperi TaxID=1882483 RepID=A0A317XJY8_9BASI|nr:hypothetical protein BCV70DRAFT_202663 [Testicularia cyperi]